MKIAVARQTVAVQQFPGWLSAGRGAHGSPIGAGSGPVGVEVAGETPPDGRRLHDHPLAVAVVSPSDADTVDDATADDVTGSGGR